MGSSNNGKRTIDEDMHDAVIQLTAAVLVQMNGDPASVGTMIGTKIRSWRKEHGAARADMLVNMMLALAVTKLAELIGDEEQAQLYAWMEREVMEHAEDRHS